MSYNGKSAQVLKRCLKGRPVWTPQTGWSDNLHVSKSGAVYLVEGNSAILVGGAS